MSNHMLSLGSNKLRSFAFFLTSTAILFFGFFQNLWHVADQDSFDTYQIGTESFIVGRLLKTKSDGIFSAGGLTGLVGPDSTPPDTEHANYRFQYKAYLESLPFQSYTGYKSQTGGQGMLFGMLDGILPWSSQDKLSFFHGLTSILSAAVLSLIFLWFTSEFGLAAGVTALIGTVLSQWLTLFGKNLWWSIWAFYLPMLIVLFYLKSTGRPLKLSPIRFGLVVFLAVLIKCFFNGFEYITTTLVMMVVPFIYFSFRDKTGWKNFISGLLAAMAASVMAILSSMTILCIQIAAVDGSFAKGVDHIIYSLLRRSYADPQLFPPDYTASLNANVFDVVTYYLREIYLDLNYYIKAPNDFIANFVFQFRYLYLILLFAAMSVALIFLFRSKQAAGLRPSGQALIAAVWFSLLAPLSWLIIFKAHSYVHTFMNDLVWQMPFTLFGFALCGLALSAAVRVLRKQPV
jgi:hypothetical protein